MLILTNAPFRQCLKQGATIAIISDSIWPQVHWIDFAHTYPSNGQQDTNVLGALDSLIELLQSIQ